MHESIEHAEVPERIELTETSVQPHMQEDSFQIRHAETQSSPQETAETAHQETKAHILEAYQGILPEARKEALESPHTLERLKALEPEAYSKQFPAAGPNVMGHCDAEGNIYIKSVSEDAVNHIATHETMHLCSNRESGFDEEGYRRIQSGLRETLFHRDGTLCADRSRGINEGATELYTLRELAARGDMEAAYAFDSYPQSREWAERLEQLVGKDTLAEGYFGDRKDVLEQEFNRYDTEQENAWETFSQNVDIVEYGTDANEIQQAQMDLSEQYMRMLMEKDLEGGA